MSEFKFEVGTRVSFTCQYHGYVRGTVSERHLFGGHIIYVVDMDGPFMLGKWGAKESELTRLVKKKKSSIPRGVTVNVCSSDSLEYLTQKVRGAIDAFHKYKADKPKQRQPLRVGERVVVKPDENGYVRSGEKGKIADVGQYSLIGKYRVEFGDNDKGTFQWLSRNQLKRLIKKPVAFKVGDRVKIKKAWKYFASELTSPAVGVIIDMDSDCFASNTPDLIRIKTADGHYWLAKKSDCVRLRKKPKAFAVGDRVLVKAIMGLGERSYTPFKTTVTALRGDKLGDRLKVKDVFDNSLSFFDWTVLAKDCVKLRKRRLRVGDRVSAKIWVAETKITGTIIRDDASYVPFLIETKNGKKYWCKEKDCKRLVRKKKAKKRFDTFKILMESLAYFKLINKNPASVKKVDESDHIASAGKKVEGEFCECKHEGLVAMKGDKHVDCGKTFDFMRYHQSKKSESEFCECEDIRVYDSITKTHTGYKNHSGCGKPIKELFSFVQQCSNCHGSGIESMEKK